MNGQFNKSYQQENYFGSRENHLLNRYDGWFNRGTRVLDIGMGQGRNVFPLAEKGCLLTGIDTAEESVRQVQDQARSKNIDLTTHLLDYQDFDPPEAFDVVLCFGLLQMLPPPQAASLVQRLRQWTQSGGVLFFIAWHVDDPAFGTYCQNWQRTGLRSFRSQDGESYRTFLGRGEILQMFRGWKVIHHWEGLGSVHRHGDGPEECHGDVEVVLQKP